MSLKFVSRNPIDSTLAVIHVMVCRRTDASHDLNKCWLNSLTHMCVTRSRWVECYVYDVQVFPHNMASSDHKRLHDKASRTLFESNMNSWQAVYKIKVRWQTNTLNGRFDERISVMHAMIHITTDDWYPDVKSKDPNWYLIVKRLDLMIICNLSRVQYS